MKQTQSGSIRQAEQTDIESTTTRTSGIEDAKLSSYEQSLP